VRYVAIVPAVAGMAKRYYRRQGDPRPPPPAGLIRKRRGACSPLGGARRAYGLAARFRQTTAALVLLQLFCPNRAVDGWRASAPIVSPRRANRQQG